MKSKWVVKKVFDHISHDVKAVSTIGLQSTLSAIVNEDYPYHRAWRAKELCLWQIYGDEECPFKRYPCCLHTSDSMTQGM